MGDAATGEVRARIPADVDAPDRVLFGLTARQALLLICVAAPAYLAWRLLTGRIPDQVLLAAAAPVAALAVGLTVGRRDGIGLDAWLAAAVRHLPGPHRLAPAPDSPAAEPAWSAAAAPRPPAALHLPVDAIDPDGVIATGDGRWLAVVATTTVNTGLLAGSEQAALVEVYARWLNGLTGPTQVVVSTRRVDLGGHALRATRTAARLPSPALKDAALGYARFLLDLCEDRDPLARSVTISCAAGTRVEAGRQAVRAAQALAALGVRAVVLDGAAVTALLTAAVDPYTPGDAGWPRTPPDAPVTGPDTEGSGEGSGEGSW